MTASLARGFLLWTLVTFMAEAAVVWGILSDEAIVEAICFNVGYLGLLIVSFSVFRRVSWTRRLGPVLIPTALIAVWAAGAWILRGDDDPIAALGAVLVVFGIMLAGTGFVVLLTRSGVMVDSPLRQRLTLLIILATSFLAFIGTSKAVRGRADVVSLVLLLAVWFWPSRSGRREVVGSEP